MQIPVPPSLRPPRPSLPDADLVYRDGDAEMVVSRMSKQLLATFVKGVVREPLVHFYIRAFHEFIDVAPAKIDIFHDWGGITSTTPEGRRAFTDWVNGRGGRNRAAIRSAHTLVESTLMYLTLGAVNVFDPRGYAIAYRDRVNFERERTKLLLTPSVERIDRSAKGT